MVIKFPYSETNGLNISNEFDLQIFDLPKHKFQIAGPAVVEKALQQPILSKRLFELARGKNKILIVADDITRPTPISKFIHLILDELARAGVNEKQIEFILALGTHVFMTRDEMNVKLGRDIVEKYRVYNHDWKNNDSLEYAGNTDQGVPVWVNKLIYNADLVIGLGSIMPIEVCGFSGGGKIIVPGVCGEITNSEMHWKRVETPSNEILGKAENPIRASIDSLARKAGLDFIVNVILDGKGSIVGAVAGDMVAAHRIGCKIAAKVYSVNIPREYDIVIADSFPFDVEFWQANKALDTAGCVVKKGGVIILVTPCYKGFSQTHRDILDFGYQSVKRIKELVECGEIKHKVVGVHMIQVSNVAVEKDKLILVSSGITKNEAEKVGFLWEETPQKAFEKALELCGSKKSIAILKNASRMLPRVGEINN
jgi:nickel-dependent lactate racemase